MPDQPVEALEDGHQSGRFDATLLERHAMLDQLTHRSRSFAITEGIGLDVPDGFRSVGHETRVMFSTRRWHLVDDGVEPLRTPTWKRGTSRRRAVDLTWGFAEDKSTTASLLRLAGHFPAHLDDPDQEAANLAALKALGPAIRELVDEFEPDKVIGSFDFNRELTLARNRELIEHSVRGLNLRLQVPPQPTEGRRTIDGFLTNAGDVTMLDRRHGFDHRGVLLHTRIHTPRRQENQP